MSFSLDISKFVERAKGDIDRAVREVVVVAAQGIVLRSPVDTGRFRANWNFSVEKPDYTVTENTDPAGGVTLGRIAEQVAAQPVGKIMFISNGLPYGRRLEYEGWSQQAPQGMVRLTAMELPNVIDTIFKGSS